MTLKPFWCYYGGKWRSAPRYPAPRHEMIIEPFAGAAGYATRYHDRKIVLVEADPLVAGLWRWLINASEGEIRALPLEVPTTIRELDLAPGPSALIGFWLNKGASAPRQSPSAWMRKGMHASSFWGREVRERIALQVGAIRHWTVIEGTYAAAPEVEATWYVDPPYQRAGVHYRRRLTPAEYPALGAWSKSRRGQVIVCEEVGADWLPFVSAFEAKANESRYGGKVCREAIWCSDARDYGA